MVTFARRFFRNVLLSAASMPLFLYSATWSNNTFAQTPSQNNPLVSTESSVCAIEAVQNTKQSISFDKEDMPC